MLPLFDLTAGLLESASLFVSIFLSVSEEEKRGKL